MNENGNGSRPSEEILVILRRAERLGVPVWRVGTALGMANGELERVEHELHQATPARRQHPGPSLAAQQADDETPLT